MGYWINRVEGMESPFQIVHEQVVLIPATGYLPVANAARKLLFVLSGEGRHQMPHLPGPIGDVVLRTGDVLSIPYRCEQRYLPIAAGNEGRLHVMRLAFDADRLPPLPLPPKLPANAKPSDVAASGARTKLEKLAARCMNEACYLPGGVEQSAGMAETLSALREEARLRQPDYEARVYGLCVSLLALFSRQAQATCGGKAYGASASGDTPAAEFHVSKIKSYLKSQIAQPFSLARIAEHACLSEEHTARLFKKVTGVTLSTYERRLRIGEAKNLLAATELNLGEIAYQSGFASLTVFSRNFKRETGMTPTEYRQQIAQQMG